MSIDHSYDYRTICLIGKVYYIINLRKRENAALRVVTNDNTQGNDGNKLK